jgi:nicotinate-nucleotide pyrophosphorylase (carboxylating)
MPVLNKENNLKNLMRQALKEDFGKGDITSDSLISRDKIIAARIFSRQNAVVCGVGIVKQLFSILDKNSHLKIFCRDGDSVRAGKTIIEVKAKARAILAGERVALNFLSHLSGIATQTNGFVKKIRNYKSKILDTRKTTPGLRALEKYAVKCGGGFNHRFGLWDMVLIKDSHKKLLEKKVRIPGLIKLAKNSNRNQKIEIEVGTLKEFKEALAANPDIIMLDNMPLSQVRQAVKLRKKSTPKLEVSGNVSLKNVQSIAKAGVDFISIGVLTHSSKAIDMKLKVA